MASLPSSRAGDQVCLPVILWQCEVNSSSLTACWIIMAGLGLMMATALAENGASRVYLVGRRQDKLQEAVASYPGCVRWLL